MPARTPIVPGSTPQATPGGPAANPTAPNASPAAPPSSDGGAPSPVPEVNKVAELERKLENATKAIEELRSKREGATAPPDINDPAVARQVMLNALGTPTTTTEVDPVLAVVASKLGPRPNAWDEPEETAAWDRAYVKEGIAQGIASARPELIQQAVNTVNLGSADDARKTENSVAEASFKAAYRSLYRTDIDQADMQAFAGKVLREFRPNGPKGGFTGQQLWDAWYMYNRDAFEAMQFSAGQAAAVRNINTVSQVVPTAGPSSLGTTDEFVALDDAAKQTTILSKMPPDLYKKYYSALPDNQKRAIRMEIRNRQQRARVDLGLE